MFHKNKSQILSISVYILLILAIGIILFYTFDNFILNAKKSNLSSTKDYWDLTAGSAMSFAGSIVAIFLALVALDVAKNQERIEIQHNLHNVRDKIIFDLHKLVILINKLIFTAKIQVAREKEFELNNINNLKQLFNVIDELSQHLENIYISYHTSKVLKITSYELAELFNKFSSSQLNNNQTKINTIHKIYNDILSNKSLNYNLEQKTVLFLGLIIKYDSKNQIINNEGYNYLCQLKDAIPKDVDSIQDYLNKEIDSKLDKNNQLSDIAYDTESIKKLYSDFNAKYNIEEEYEIKYKNANINEIGEIEFDINIKTEEKDEKDIELTNDVVVIKQLEQLKAVLEIEDSKKIRAISNFYKTQEDSFRGETFVKIDDNIDENKCIATYVLFNPNKGTKQIIQNNRLIKISNKLLSDNLSLISSTNKKEYTVSTIDQNIKALYEYHQNKKDKGFIRIIYLYDIIFSNSTGGYAKYSKENIDENSAKYIGNYDFNFNEDEEYIFVYGAIMKEPYIQKRVKEILNLIKDRAKVFYTEGNELVIKPFNESNLENPPKQPLYYKNNGYI